MPCLRQASLLGSTSSPPHALPGEAAHQGQRLPWLTPNDSQGPWSPLRDSRSSWTLRPCHRTVCTAHTGRALPLHCNQCRVPISATVRPWLCRRSAYASVSWPTRVALYALRMARRCGRARPWAMWAALITFPTSSTLARATGASGWRVASAHIAAMAPETCSRRRIGLVYIGRPPLYAGQTRVPPALALRELEP